MTVSNEVQGVPEDAHLPRQNRYVREMVVNRDVVFSEINAHKRAELLFPPANSPDLDQPKTYRVAVKTPAGIKEGSLTIRPAAGLSRFTTYSYDVVLGLGVIWEAENRPTGPIHCSFNRLWTAMEQKNKPSTKDYDRLKEHLDILANTGITWNNSFISADEIVSEQDTYRLLQTCHIKTVKDKRTGKMKSAGFTFEFHKTHLKNIHTGHVIPVSMKARRMVHNNLAKAILPTIDRTLVGFVIKSLNRSSNHIDEYTKRCSMVLKELLPSLDADYYRPPSKQKQLCQSLAKGLDGIPLSYGGGYVIKAAAIQGKKEWMINFRAYNTTPEPESKIPKASRPLNQNVLDLLVDEVGNMNNLGFYKSLARRYSHTVVTRAISEWKDKVNRGEVKDKDAYFTSCIHRIVHSVGDEWIKDCGDDCPLNDA